METYSASHKELDKTFNSVKSELKGDYEKAMYALDHKVEISMLRENMETLTGLLSVKFK